MAPLIDDYIEKIRLLEPNIKQNGTYFDAKFSGIRQKKWSRKDCFNSIIKEAKFDVNEISYYISGPTWSDENMPLVLFNIHTSKLNNSIINLKIYEATKTNTFIISTLSNQLINKDFFKEFNSLYKSFLGVKGYLFENVSYELNCESSIEWAYRNIPAKLKNGYISNWLENAVLIP